jgi:thioredoxin-related protein
MKKLLSISFAVFAIANAGYSQIKFENISLADAMTKAKAEKKKIFVDVYTSWCGPCKILDANVFSDKKVGERMTEEYISVKLENEKSEFRGDFTKFNIQGYPTMLILDENGSEISRIVGSIALDAFQLEMDSYSTKKYSPISQAFINLKDKSTGQAVWKENLVYLDDNINSIYNNSLYDVFKEACTNYYQNFDITTYDGDGDLKIFRHVKLPLEHTVVNLYLKDSNEYAHYRHKDYMTLVFIKEVKNSKSKAETEEIKIRAKKYFQDHFNRLNGDCESEEWFMDNIFVKNAKVEEEVIEEKVVEEENTKEKKKKSKKK